MKRAVSISIGSSKRNKAVEIELLGERVNIERIGTDGDMEAAAQKFRELDGQVDAFGLGGTDLGLAVDGKYYPLHSVQKIVRYVKQTPLVDGGGLKNTLEKRMGDFLEARIGEYLHQQGRKAFIAVAIDRWGMATSFRNAGYECIYGDLMFSLGLPIPIRSAQTLKVLASVLLPILSRLPFEWLYPTGQEQEKHTPKWEPYFRWATVIAGDCHYIKRYLPEGVEGKVIATNTTTPADVELFRRLGIKYLATSTPVLDGRSFGTNMMEAALVAISGKGRRLSEMELSQMLDRLGLEPQLQELNEWMPS